MAHPPSAEDPIMRWNNVTLVSATVALLAAPVSARQVDDCHPAALGMWRQRRRLPDKASGEPIE